jgi:hypothetical protein
LVALASVAGWVWASSWQEFEAEWPALAARQATQRWAEGRAAPPERERWGSVREDLLQSAAARGNSPRLHEDLGNLYRVAVRQDWATDEERGEWLAEARGHYQKSIELAPADGMPHALLAAALAESGLWDQRFEQAVQEARRLAPHDNHVEAVLMRTALAYWDEVPPALQEWAANLYEEGTLAQRRQIERLAKPFGLVFESTTQPR